MSLVIHRLSLDDLAKAGAHGLERWLRVLEGGLVPEYEQDDRNPLDHILGAWGECLIARLTGESWPTDLGPDHHAPDVGDWHVRTGRRASDRLIIREEDPDDARFVLVVHLGDDRFNVVGWCWGYEGKDPEYLEDINGRPPAYFVPQTALRGWTA